MKRMLLHTCCGPCSLGVIDTLNKEYEITLFFYNPNLWPEKEYNKRKEAAISIAEKMNLKILVWERDHMEWIRFVGYENENEGGKRCDNCYYYRIKRTAKEAKRRGIEIIATTLTISPHKDSKRINEIGRKIALEEGITFLEADFKREDGYSKSIRKSKELGVYRQNYCGCEYSIREKEKKNIKR